MIDGRSYGLKFAKPSRVEEDISRLTVLGSWVAVKEDLARVTDSGLLIPDRKNTVVGTVVKAGPAAEGLKPGDRVYFQEWQGGRWSFRDAEAPSGEAKFLIMNVEDVLLRVEE